MASAASIPSLDDMGRDCALGHALHTAVDDMAVYRCLDLEGHRGDRVLAGVQELSAKHADPPVVRALHELLDDDPVGDLDEPSGDPEETRDIHDFFDPERERCRRLLDNERCPQRIEELRDPFDTEIVFREKDGLRERDVLSDEVRSTC